MLLNYLDKPIIIHAIETLHSVCDRVIVVTGHYHDEIVEFLKNYSYVKIIYNEQYAKGMFSSIQAGVKEVINDFFIIPGDYPLIEITTYKKMLESKGSIIVPSYENHLGHPIYFDFSYKEKIINTQLDNLKEFRNQYEFTIIEVEDRGILIDIDNMSDYKNLIRED